MLATLGGIGQFSCDAVIMALWILSVLTLPMLDRRPRPPLPFSPWSGDRGDGGASTAGETGEIGETAPGVSAELMWVGGGEIMDTERWLLPRLGLEEWLDCCGAEEGGEGAGRGAMWRDPAGTRYWGLLLLLLVCCISGCCWAG